MRTNVIAYRLFDVADEINLDQVQAIWHSRNKMSSRLRLDRISTKSITFHDPPVLVELGYHEMIIGGVEYLVEVKARIQDLGVICILFNIPPEEDITYQEYLNLVLAVEELPDEDFRKFVDATMETIGPACTNQNISGFDEDFVVYYFQDPIPPDWDIVPFLLKDPSPVNEETRETALANRFSYADDIAWLAWDSAVVYDPSGSMDIPDLLEFANAQYLELRYYCEQSHQQHHQRFAGNGRYFLCQSLHPLHEAAEGICVAGKYRVEDAGTATLLQHAERNRNQPSYGADAQVQHHVARHHCRHFAGNCNL